MPLQCLNKPFMIDNLLNLVYSYFLILLHFPFNILFYYWILFKNYFMPVVPFTYNIGLKNWTQEEIWFHKTGAFLYSLVDHAWV